MGHDSTVAFDSGIEEVIVVCTTEVCVAPSSSDEKKQPARMTVRAMARTIRIISRDPR
jgi:hypothetical protein